MIIGISMGHETWQILGQVSHNLLLLDEKPSTPHRSETNGVAERALRRVKKKAPLLYCCNQVWMKNGGRIPWNVTPFCETFKISCLMGRHHMKGGSECLLTDQ